MGKYGSFPSNLIIERPFHLTYEVQDKRDGEDFSRLRVVPASELNEDALADTSEEMDLEPTEGCDVITTAEGEEMTLVDESGHVVARSNREIIDDAARQTLTAEEIEELKREGASAGKELIAKLLLSHSAIDQKTAYSLAKYKLLKTKKYIRRFTVLPIDVPLLSQWLLEDRDASKIMEIRQEMLALAGCWADVHFADQPSEGAEAPYAGRWLMVDDTGGLFVAAMAERMGILHREPEQEENIGVESQNGDATTENSQNRDGTTNVNKEAEGEADKTSTQSSNHQRNRRKRPQQSDFDVHYAKSNTITLLHSNSQPNLAILRYFNFDSNDPNPPYPYHPLFSHILPVSWLQLLSPEEDTTYMETPPEVEPAVLASWKTGRRSNYHRKRRRWARTRHIVAAARQGNFAGLAVASTMDTVSVLRSTLPLLAGGAPVAVYSPSIEPLAELADCFSVARRAAWVSSPPAGAEGRAAAELERWEGSPEFPVNPTLLIAVAIQSCRARRWQVLPGRTHPFMTGRGGAEGYVFTGWRAVPVEGRVAARGKFGRRRGEAK